MIHQFPKQPRPRSIVTGSDDLTQAQFRRVVAYRIVQPARTSERVKDALTIAAMFVVVVGFWGVLICAALQLIPW